MAGYKDGDVIVVEIDFITAGFGVTSFTLAWLTHFRCTTPVFVVVWWGTWPWSHHVLDHFEGIFREYQCGVKNTEDMALKPDQLLMARTVYHIVVAATHLYTTAWFASFDFVGIQSSQKMVDLMRFADRYLTGWNFALQIAHLVMALYCDYAELKRDPALEEKLAKVKNIRDFLFTSLVFPGSMFVATMFWIVFTMDREMVLPKECDQFIPMWVNHITHTWIVPVVLLEVALQPRTRPNDETPHLLTLLGYHTLYTAVLLGTYFSTGRWIYPLYNSMTWVQRSILLTLIFYLSMAFYYVGWHTNDLIWRNAFAGDESPEGNKNTSQDKSTVSKALAKSIVEINERGFAMYDEGF